jgi:Aldehyde dehydrogenase family
MLRRVLCIPTGQTSTTVMSNIGFAASTYPSTKRRERGRAGTAGNGLSKPDRRTQTAFGRYRTQRSRGRVRLGRHQIWRSRFESQSEGVHDSFLDEVLKVAADWHLGDPFDEATLVGPMNNEPTAGKMDRHLEDAVDKGANVVLGGSRSADRPTRLYYEPTVVTDVGVDTHAERLGPHRRALHDARHERPQDRRARRRRARLDGPLRPAALSA